MSAAPRHMAPGSPSMPSALHPSIFEQSSRNLPTDESRTLTSIEQDIPKSWDSGDRPSSFVIFMTSFMFS